MKSLMIVAVVVSALSLGACGSTAGQEGKGRHADALHAHDHADAAKCTHDAAKCAGCAAGTCDPAKCPMKAGKTCCGTCGGDAAKCTGGEAKKCCGTCGGGAKTDAPKACCGKCGGPK